MPYIQEHLSQSGSLLNNFSHMESSALQSQMSDGYEDDDDDVVLPKEEQNAVNNDKSDNSEESHREAGKYEFRFKSNQILKGKGGQKTYRCDICGGKYKHAFSLKRHYLRTHINSEYLSLNDISNCNISVQQTPPRKVPEAKNGVIGTSEMENHSESNTVCMPDLYRCHMCSRFFDEIDDLKIHVANHPEQPNDKRFCCMECKMTFSHRQNLVRHLSVHSGVKPYACRHCGKRFPTATNQKRHERIHDGIKPYKCSHCSSLFTQSGDLKKHIRKQHNRFFHPCTLCVKYFPSSESLQNHLVSHGEEPNFRFRHLKEKSLKSIMKKKARNKSKAALEAKFARYLCNICHKRFSNQSFLLNHHKSVHSCKINKTRRSTNSLLIGNNFGDETLLEVPSTEADFYADIAYNISDNLLNHLDGKLNGDMHHDSDIEQNAEHKTNNSKLHWSQYNFPDDFDIDSTMSDSSADEQSTDTTGFDLSLTRPCDDTSFVMSTSCVLLPTELMNCLSLSSVTNSNSSKMQFVDGVLDLSLPSKCGDEITCELKNEGSCIQMPKLFVCFVCGESVSSLDDIENHKINNHPNVQCNHLEVECPKDMPLEVFKHNSSSVGLLKTCTVPPSIMTMEKLSCTKCHQSFEASADLHSHMLECGGHIERPIGKKKHKRHRSQKKMVSRGMKRKLELPSTKENFKVSTVCTTQIPRSVMITGSGNKCSRTFSSCRWCKKRFSSHMTLVRHKKICVQKTAEKAKENKDIRLQHSCPYCSRSFTYLASLKKHVLDCVSYSGNRGKKTKTLSVSVKSPVDSDGSWSTNEAETVDSIPKSPEVEKSHSPSPVNEDKTDQNTTNSENPSVVVKTEASETSNDSEEEILKILRQYKEFENDLEEKDIELNIKEEKRDQQTYSCPHCKRTYTYMANFKKHVKDACPLRKDSSASVDGASSDGEKLSELKTEENNSVETITLKDEVEEPKKRKHVDVAKHLKTLELKDISTEMIAAKCKEAECSRLKPMDCPVCHKIFFSYVKLLQHQLLHKLNSKDDEAIEIDDDLHKCEKELLKLKNQDRGVPLKVKSDTAVKSAVKAKGGWPKGKSRKGYIPKHKQKQKISKNAKSLSSSMQNDSNLRKVSAKSKRFKKFKNCKSKSTISSTTLRLPNSLDCIKEPQQ